MAIAMSVYVKKLKSMKISRCTNAFTLFVVNKTLLFRMK